MDWQTDGQTDWLSDWLTDWLIDRLTDWQTDRLTDWQTDWLSDWLTDWLTYRQTDRLTDWQTDRLTDWLLTDWLTDRLTDWLVHWLMDRQTDMSEWMSNNMNDTGWQVYMTYSLLDHWIMGILRALPLIVYGLIISVHAAHMSCHASSAHAEKLNEQNNSVKPLLLNYSMCGCLVNAIFMIEHFEFSLKSTY